MTIEQIKTVRPGDKLLIVDPDNDNNWKDKVGLVVTVKSIRDDHFYVKECSWGGLFFKHAEKIKFHNMKRPLILEL